MILTLTKRKKEEILTDLIAYEGTLYTPTTCQDIIRTYDTNLLLPTTDMYQTLKAAKRSQEESTPRDSYSGSRVL